MSSERRARADDEVEGPAALSNFLMDTLRPPRPEPVAAALESAADEPAAKHAAAEQAAAEEPAAEKRAAEKPAAEQSARGERWEDDGEHTPALGTAVDAAHETEASEAGPLLGAPRLPAIDSDFEDEGPPWSELPAEPGADEDPELDDPALVAPPILPASEGEAPPDVDDPDPAALFLLQERSARRNQRVAVAAVVAFLLLIGGSYLLMRGGASEPEAQAAEAPAAAPAHQPPAAARPAEPAAPESAEEEVPEEAPVPGMKAGFSAVLRAPGSAEPIIPGGPSTARYPDLPREVLIQLESAADTEKQAP
jgi:hypothetical protein